MYGSLHIQSNRSTVALTFARESRAGGVQSLPEVEAEQVGAGKDDETEGLGRLGGKLRRRNWRQGLTVASRPDINRERSATERFRSASLWQAVWSEAEHRLTLSRVPGRAALRGWGLAPHPFKDGESGQSLNSRRSLTLPAQWLS